MVPDRPAGRALPDIIDAQPVYLKARYRLRLPRGEKAFLKVYHSDGPYALRQAARERASLRNLAGFAVPRLLQLPPEAVRRILGFRPRAYLAQSHVPGVPLDQAGFSPPELLGAWIFLAEQLAAFRRRRVFYTDVKCSNVLATRRPLRAVQIDFNLATAVRPSRSYPARWIGYTVGLQAPEHGRTGRLTETAVVFQLGMLLAEAWIGVNNGELYGPVNGLARLHRAVGRSGSKGLADLVASCLSPRPERRARDYEEVWRRIRALLPGGIPHNVLRAWEALRVPYADRLTR